MLPEIRDPWTRHMSPPEAKYTFENKRYRTIAKTHNDGWVWGAEVINLKLHADRIRTEKVLTLTVEYATIVELQGNYDELFD